MIPGRTTTAPSRPGALRCAAILCAAILCGITGCAGKGGQPGPGSGSLSGPQAGTTLAADEELQSAAMSFADRYVAAMADACDRAQAAAVSPEQRIWIQRDQSMTTLAAFTIAAGASPRIALLDLAVLVTLQRTVLEELWTKAYPAEITGPLIQATKSSEVDIWQVLASFMSDQQQSELRDLIARWRKDNPDQRLVANVRFGSFDVYRNRAAEVANSGRHSLFALLYLDPFPNLDPTVREVAQIRRLVERESYFLERLPIVLQYQSTLFVERTLAQPGVQGALRDAHEFSAATDRFATASQSLVKDLGAESRVLLEQFNHDIAAERQALTSDLSKTLDQQRAALVTDLETHSQKARDLLADVRSASERLEALSVSVHGTVDAIDKLATPTPLKPGEEPSRPFDVREYGAAADRIAAAAKDTTALLKSINETISAPAPGPDAAATTAYGAMVTRLDETLTCAVHTAFWRTLILLLVALAGTGAIVVLARRRARPGAA